MISEAGLRRLRAAVEKAGNAETVTVRADDVFCLVRDYEQLRKKSQDYDELQRALSLIGEVMNGD